ncbi:MAG: DUF4388 domain-containing protein [Thermoanaerobaculia bacterium]|nr:DUF4388 domain-containing protein [Thermoanaerobaculia bacterium]
MAEKEKVALSGDLEVISVPDVLSFISMIRSTGDLVFRKGDIQQNVHWKDGEMVFAHSNSQEHSLGEFLLRNGKITKEQLDDSRKHLEPGVRHGKLLVQLGYLSPKDLWWGVKEQVLEIIFSMFSWNEGDFEFIASEAELGERITLTLNTSTIIMEGIRRLDESERISEKITGNDMVFYKLPVTDDEIESLGLSESDRRIYEEIDGEKTITDLVRAAGDRTEFEVKQLLYQMLSARLIDEMPSEETFRPVFLDVEDSPELLRIISTYNDMFAHLFSTLLETVGEDEAREIFTAATISAENDELWEGVFFDQFGRFDENMLVANISELPFEKRKSALDEGLNNLLSIQLFEVSQHLPTDKKNEIFQFISDQKAELEKAVS